MALRAGGNISGDESPRDIPYTQIHERSFVPDLQRVNTTTNGLYIISIAMKSESTTNDDSLIAVRNLANRKTFREHRVEQRR